MSSSNNDNKSTQTLISTTSSPMEKEGTKNPSSPLPLPRAEQAQDNDKLTEMQTVQLAFLSERTAADFMSIFGSDSPLFKRVYEIGTELDELITARDDYLAKRDQIKLSLQSLGSRLPRTPYLADMVRKINSADILGNQEVENLSKPTSDRHGSDLTHPLQANARPTPPSHDQLRNCGIVVKNDKPNQAKPVKEDSRPPTLSGRQTTRPSQHRLPKCPHCGGLGHKQTSCKNYFCIHCRTDAPGHFAKHCPRNPYQGVDRRLLPTDAMAVLLVKEELFSSQSNPSDNDVRKLTTTLLSRQSGIPTPPHSPKDTIAKSSLPSTPAHTVLATGPTYKPILAIPKKCTSPGNRKNLGGLRQLSPTSSHTSSGGNTPNQRTPAQHYARPRSPTPYDGDYEDHFDDEGYYNIDGEGNF